MKNVILPIQNQQDSPKNFNAGQVTQRLTD